MQDSAVKVAPSEYEPKFVHSEEVQMMFSAAWLRLAAGNLRSYQENLHRAVEFCAKAQELVMHISVAKQPHPNLEQEIDAVAEMLKRSARDIEALSAMSDPGPFQNSSP